MDNVDFAITTKRVLPNEIRHYFRRLGKYIPFLADKASRSLASVRGNYVWSIELVVFPCSYCTCIVPGNWLQPINFSSFPLVLSRFCLQKSVMHVQSCCFANQSKPEAVICFCLNLLLFCRSRCRHRRHCLTLITPTPPTKHRVKKKSALNVDSASAFFFIATSCFWNPPLLPPTTEDKDRYAFSKLPTQELMIYRRSHVTLAHTAHHSFFKFMSRESTSESRLFSFFFFFVFKSHVT